MVQAKVLTVALFRVLVLQRLGADFQSHASYRNCTCLLSTFELPLRLSWQRNCLSSLGHDARPDQPHLWVLGTPPATRFTSLVVACCVRDRR
jgi:hypothetical protein